MIVAGEPHDTPKFRYRAMQNKSANIWGSTITPSLKPHAPKRKQKSTRTQTWKILYTTIVVQGHLKQLKDVRCCLSCSLNKQKCHQSNW